MNPIIFTVPTVFAIEPETGNRIGNLTPTWPQPNEPVSQGDDHLRATKRAVQGSFPVIGIGQVTATAEEMNHTYDNVTGDNTTVILGALETTDVSTQRDLTVGRDLAVVDDIVAGNDITGFATLPLDTPFVNEHLIGGGNLRTLLESMALALDAIPALQQEIADLKATIQVLHGV